MKKLLFIVLVLINLSALVGSDQLIDSLKSVIKGSSHDTLVSTAYLQWGERVYLNNPDTAKILWTHAHDIAQRNLDLNNKDSKLKLKFSWLLAESLNNIGYILKIKGDLAQGLEYYTRSVAVYESINDKEGLAYALNNIGVIYRGQGAIDKALQYYGRCLMIREEIGDKKGEALVINNLGKIYLDQGEIEKGLEYYIKALALNEEIDFKRGIALSLNNLGYGFEVYGDPACTGSTEDCMKLGRDKGLEFYFKSLSLCEEIGNKSGMATAMNNIGNIYRSTGDIEKVMEYFNRSLELREEIGNKLGIAISSNNLAGAILMRNEGGVVKALETAKEYATRSMELGLELGAPIRIHAASLTLSKIAKFQGDYKEALSKYELSVKMRDSVKNEETQKATIHQQTKYEFEKAMLLKEQEENEKHRILNEKLKRRDNLQYSIVLIGLLVIGVLVAMLGRLSLPVRVAEGLIFFAFLIFFEFILVLADPYIDNWSGGAPGIKLLFNAGIAACIFPLHAFFESKLKNRLAN